MVYPTKLHCFPRCHYANRNVLSLCKNQNVALKCSLENNKIQKKRKQSLRFLGTGHPANNRYRCFLSNLAGLAAPPPPGSRIRPVQESYPIQEHLIQVEIHPLYRLVKYCFPRHSGNTKHGVEHSCSRLTKQPVQTSNKREQRCLETPTLP